MSSWVLASLRGEVKKSKLVISSALQTRQLSRGPMASEIKKKLWKIKGKYYEWYQRPQQTDRNDGCSCRLWIHYIYQVLRAELGAKYSCMGHLCNGSANERNENRRKFLFYSYNITIRFLIAFFGLEASPKRLQTSKKKKDQENDWNELALKDFKAVLETTMA